MMADILEAALAERGYEVQWRTFSVSRDGIEFGFSRPGSPQRLARLFLSGMEIAQNGKREQIVKLLSSKIRAAESELEGVAA